MNKPLISVIIPAHNSESTIGVAIDSMLTQTYPNLEIIVVDDNSTDNTEKVVREYETQNKKIQYYKLPYDDPNRVNKRGRNVNAGYLARNYGFEKARGEWITFQDADDASLVNRIEAQYNLAIEYGASHVCIQWQQFKEELLGKRLDIGKIFQEERNMVITNKEIIALAKKTKGVIIPFLGKLNSFIPFEWKRMRVINKFFFQSLDSYPGSGNSPLFKKEIVEKVRFRPVNERVWPSFTGRGADRDFNFQVAETFGNNISFKLPLYLWRVGQENNLGYNFKKYLIK
ncbi:MAG: glycosyltransferase family 2 protein [Patescibacteria group bacterium]